MASPRSRSSTRSAASVRRRWRRCAEGSSPSTLATGVRFAALGGLTAGLAASPAAGVDEPVAALAFAAASACGLIAARPRGRGVAAVLWLACLALAAATAGLGVGAARIAALDAGALDLAAGRSVVVRGHVAAVPRRAEGEVGLPVATADGRLLVEAREPLGELPVGREVVARGVIRDPEPWRRAHLERLGVRDVLSARSLRLTGRRRGGAAGVVDLVRDRAELALGRGTDPASASLLRGFVLGQDDRIDAVTVEQFKRSGLAHLLAVSGQNVVLLALLAAVVLAALDVTLRARLVWTLALILLYVPVAGAGPSIQRAGVMGAAGIVAALASRPRSRWYALLLAAAATLALNPRAAADVGWQLSFAAVAGILLWSRPLAGAIAPRRGSDAGARGRLRVALAEGIAVTVAATLATAPLMAHHFEAVSVVALPANLLAMPAVAPVMWLGMLSAAAGQLPWLPVEPLTWLAGLLAAYLARVAEWLASPEWALADVSVGGRGLAIAWIAIAIAIPLLLGWHRRRRALELSSLALGGDSAARASRRGPALAVALGLAVSIAIAVALGGGAGQSPSAGLRVTMLDVGQGDSILLEPAGGAPLLIDAGPAGATVAERLSERGIDHLGALVVTHPQADHAGGAAAVLERVDTDALVQARPDRELRRSALAAGTAPERLAAGGVIRAGRLRLEALWPPPALLRTGAAGDDPNRLSLVLLARWRGFELLLTGDAEAELAPMEPGSVDVIKVAHHGSEDAGLDHLLDRASPRLALISVGAENPYGHPSPRTLGELAAHGVATLRTDRDGEIAIDVFARRWTVH